MMNGRKRNKKGGNDGVYSDESSSGARQNDFFSLKSDEAAVSLTECYSYSDRFSLENMEDIYNYLSTSL
jgi:hypothetical protein